MAGESQYMEAGLLAFESSDFGATFTAYGVTGPCSFGTKGYGGRFVGAGISPGSEAIVVIRKAVLGKLMKIGDRFQITDGNGTVHQFKIATDGIRDCIFAWELTLNDPNQNA